MIVFSQSKDVLDMAIGKGYMICNLSNLLFIGRNLDLHMPPEVYPGVTYDDDNYQMYYSRWIFSDKSAFVDFFFMCFGEYFNGNCLVLTTIDSPYMEIIIETLMTIITNRYGIKTIIADNTDDVYKAIEYPYKTPQQKEFFNMDKCRFDSICIDQDSIQAALRYCDEVC